MVQLPFIYTQTGIPFFTVWTPIR